MNTTATRAIFVLASLLAAQGSAWALNTRTWISGTGVDQAGCGPIASPCRTLQYAHDNTNPGGEIDVKDSAGYGSLKITKAISVVSDGSLGGVLALAGGNAIEVNAGASDLVVLRGLTVEGAGVGANGIVFNSGGTLDIASCIVQNFTAAGISLVPASGTPNILVSDTTASFNGSAGIFFLPPSGTVSGNLRFYRVDLSGNVSSGLALNQNLAAGSTKAVVLNSTFGNNTGNGVFVTGNVVLAIDFSTATKNASSGFSAGSGSSLTIGRSESSYNSPYGLRNSGVTVTSFGDNRFVGNVTSATFGTIGPAPLN